MMKSQCLSFLVILFTIAACAPINYEATYRPLSGHDSIYRSSQTYVRPIQVTLYTDSTYSGVKFVPIQIVISNGEYVEIPVKNRRGRSSRIFAHYHHGNLHFDNNRKCQKLQGSTGYQYDRRWDKGYKYTHVNAGHDYDFTGLRLVIRNVPKADNRPGQFLTAKSPKIHNKTLNAEKYQAVKYNNKNSNNKKIAVHKQLKNVKRKVVAATKTSKQPNQSSSDKRLDSKDKTRVIGAGELKKLVEPNIIREVSRHDKAGKTAVTVRRNDPGLANKPASKRSVAAQGIRPANETKRQQVKPQNKSVNAAPDVNKANQGQSIEGRASVSKKAKQVQSIPKKASRAQGQKQPIDKAGIQQEPPELSVIAHPQGRNKHAKGKIK
ncbi:hypothetical protein P9J64_02395 [Deltaproteobacteria bacterium IMCC39524]|nr:hypothetical protein [Deltaproteobacteria bacterium IMCC39524]